MASKSHYKWKHEYVTRHERSRLTGESFLLYLFPVRILAQLMGRLNVSVLLNTGYWRVTEIEELGDSKFQMALHWSGEPRWQIREQGDTELSRSARDELRKSTTNKQKRSKPCLRVPHMQDHSEVN